MNTPFKKGDKVSVKIKGQVVEAIVNQTWNEEVQVRTADKKLHWRVPKTVTLVEAAPKTIVETVESAPEPAGKGAQAQARNPKNSAGNSVPYKRSRGWSNKRRKI